METLAFQEIENRGCTTIEMVVNPPVNTIPPQLVSLQYLPKVPGTFSKNYEKP